MPETLSTGVILDAASFDNGDIDLAPLLATLPHWQIHRETQPAQLPARIRRAEVAVTNKVLLAESTLRAAKNLKLICIAATGTNNVDLAAARELGITVCNVTDYCTRSVTEHVFSLIFALRRNLLAYEQMVRNGGWSRSRMFCRLDFPIAELGGSTLGIIGHGVLGRAVAQAAECLGMNVLISQSLRGNAQNQSGRVPLDELLTRADIVSLHCPLADETRGLIGQRELALMKNDAILINTARGALVREADLLQALRNGEIGGAGLDVLETEPPKADNPLLRANLPGLVITPHVAWASRIARQALVDKMAKNVAAFVRGDPTHVVS